MKRNRTALTLPFFLVFMTACADVPTDGSDAPVMRETNMQTQTAYDDVVMEETQETGLQIESEADAERETEADKERVESKICTFPDTVVTKLSENLYDFQLSIDGIVYQFPMQYADFEAMGWTYEGDSAYTLSANQYVALQRWEKDDIYVYTKLANLSDDTAALSGSMVAGINIERSMAEGCDSKILLPGGIKWGVSNADDIREAYGEPVSDYDGERYYKMTYLFDYCREIDLYVYKDTNTLEQIDMENLSLPEAASDNAGDAGTSE